MNRIWRELPITDPLERRQAPLLLMLLPLMFVTALLRSVFFFQLDRATNGTALTVLISVIALGSPAIGLLLLFRGRFSAAALLAALSMLLGVVLVIVADGLRHSGMLPLVFALPIVFAGLLLGWRSLTLICLLSCAAIIGIAVLESQSSPLVGYTPSPELPASMASIFIVVVIMLFSILAWFRRDFRNELDSRLQTEQILRQSEARFATAFRASPAAMLIARLSDGCFLDVNASYERLFGYRRDEVIGQVEASTSIYTYPEQRAAIADMLEQRGALRDQELILRTKSGDVHTYLCSAEILTLGGERCVLGSLVDITELKQAERMVRESGERLAGIVDSAMDAIISINPAHNIILFNTAAERLFGCSATDALGQSLDRFIPAQFRDVHAQHIEAFGHSGTTTRSMQSSGVLTALRADGFEFPIEATISQVEVAGQTMCTVIVRDITERKQTEQALRYQADLLEQVSDAIISVDNRFVVKTWNAGATRLYGWHAHEAIGLHLSEILPAQYLDSDPEQSRASLAAHGYWQGEVVHPHRDGSLRTILSSVRLLTDSAGNPAGAVGVNRDITKRKQAEKAMQRATERLRVLAEASRSFAETGDDQQALLDKVARITAETLQAACNIRLLSEDRQWLDVAALGHYDPARLVRMRTGVEAWRVKLDDPAPAAFVTRTGQPQFVPVVDREALHASVPPEQRSILNQFSPHSLIVVPLLLHDRSIGSMILTRGADDLPAFDTDDLSLAQALSDRAALAISNVQLLAQIQAERAQLASRVEERTVDLSLANAELARAARLKDEFLATMSHELRTPLNSILGRSEALKEQIYGPLTPKQGDVLRGLEESGRHLLSLINDILDLSKIEADKLDFQVEPVHVDLLCRMSVRMITQTALKKRITVTSTIDRQVETITADERRLKQILVNLLSNAVKFTPEGGKVGLEVQGDIERQTATFTVWDTGIGIAEADLPKLFKPFVQIDSKLSRQYEGTGLGLALVRRLAEAHGGSVALESQADQGSRFSVTLPWKPAQTKPTPPPDTAASDTSLPAVHQALVIEDSPTSAERITHFLSELRTKVKLHTQGSGAVEQAIVLQPDLIVLDIMLPDIVGWDVLRQLKAEPRTQAIPVVIVSVVDDPERARALGAAAFLLKPLDRETLIQTLRRVVSVKTEPRIERALVIAPRVEQVRILLAEDNQSNIELLEYYLHAKGYDVTIARNGGEALIRAQETPPAAILMDIQMPGMDGLEAIRRIRADAGLRAIPIIALTALAMSGDRERCMAAGADEYLTKPVDLAKLVVMIERLRQRRELPDESTSSTGSPDFDR